MDKIRVAIVDDQRLFASSLRIVLRGHGQSQIEVVGMASNGKESLDLVERTRPDVVLMDIRMPVMDGVEATKEIRARFPDMKIMILTTFDDDDYVFGALQNGADAYVLKSIEPEELVTSIVATHNGQFLVSSSVGRKLLSHVDLSQTQEAAAPDWDSAVESIAGKYPFLARREAEVLCLICSNWDNHEISERLYIAEQTVRNYTSRIYTKLGVPDRLHAMKKVSTEVAGLNSTSQTPKPGREK